MCGSLRLAHVEDDRRRDQEKRHRQDEIEQIAHVEYASQGVRVLSLEDRSDPVALLGSLVNAAADDRLTVVVDTAGAVGGAAYVTAGRAVDASDHSELRAEVGRLHELGYLT